jgi:glucosamine--fructose-6-phosphate aminotransferase (isomerizing)
MKVLNDPAAEILIDYENFPKDPLEEEGIKPVSQTDSEIAAMVINKYYDGNPVEAIKKACERFDGAYGFCILFKEFPGEIYAIRNGSPLVAANFEGGSVIASDVVALIKYTKDYFVLQEQQIARLTKDTIEVQDMDGNKVTPENLHVSWDIAAARKGGYDYFMLKEIHEQPEALQKTIMPRVKDGMPYLLDDGIDDEVFKNCNRVVIAGCGTAMHAGLIGKNMIEKLTRVPVSVEIASEYRYADPIIDDKTLFMCISQSGETADTIAALRLAKEKGAKTISVVNVKGSSIARESDYVLYTHAGPEIAVASTKAYTVQLSCMYLVAFRMAAARGTVEETEIRELVKLLKKTVDDVTKILKYDNQIENISTMLHKASNLFFIGR